MPNEPSTLTAVGLVAATYLAHSTLLLGLAWLAARFASHRTPALAEQLWKTAAVLGLATALVHATLVANAHHERAAAASPRERGATATSFNHDASLPAPAAELTATDAWDALDSASAPMFDRNETLEPSARADGDATAMLAANEFSESTRTELTSASDGETSISPIARLSPTERGERHDDSAALLVPATAAKGLGAAFAVLAALGAGRMLVLTFRLRRRLRDADRLTSGPVRRELDRLLRRAAVHRHVRLLSSARFAEPAAVGTWCWWIIVPPGIEQRLPADELRALLSHELAHLVRGDGWWLWIGRALTAILPLQPLNFLARRRWQQAAEDQCDAWAVRQGAEPMALARCLTRIAGWRMEVGSPAFGLTATGACDSSLTRRVERLLSGVAAPDRWSSRGRRRLLVLAAATLGLAVVWHIPRASLLADERGARTDSRLEALGETPSGSDDAATGETSLAEELQRLDADLAHVLGRLHHAEKLLVGGQRGPDVQAAIAALRSRAERLEHRRVELAKLAVAERGTSAETQP
ncbi:MAG: M56 family metallopeptidase [Planctomycetes bacterium]|nr:M56 family metallopeptidase [Planctomycetota bacterium]